MTTVETEYPVSNEKGYFVSSEGELFKDRELVRGDPQDAAGALSAWDFLAGNFRNFGRAREGGKFSVIECCAMPSVYAPTGNGSEVVQVEFEFSTMQNVEHEEGKLPGYNPEQWRDHPHEAVVLEALGLLRADIIMEGQLDPVFHRVVLWPDRPHYYSLTLWTPAKHKEYLVPVAELVSRKIRADSVLSKAHVYIG